MGFNSGFKGLIMSFDDGGKNNGFVVLNLCQNQVISVKSEMHKSFLPPPRKLINVICGTRSLPCSQEFCSNKQWLSYSSAD